MDELKHLGWLARIELSDAELKRYALQVEDIIKYLDKLDTIPLEQVKPMVPIKNVADLRPDEVEAFEGEVLGMKYRKDGFVKGPRMT